MELIPTPPGCSYNVFFLLKPATKPNEPDILPSVNPVEVASTNTTNSIVATPTLDPNHPEKNESARLGKADEAGFEKNHDNVPR